MKLDTFDGLVLQELHNADFRDDVTTALRTGRLDQAVREVACTVLDAGYLEGLAGRLRGPLEDAYGRGVDEYLADELGEKARRVVAELGPVLASIGVRICEPPIVAKAEIQPDDETLFGLALYLDERELPAVDVRGDVAGLVARRLRDAAAELAGVAERL